MKNEATLEPVKQASDAGKPPAPPNGSAPPKIEVKSVKHTFDSTERQKIGSDLARTIGELRGIGAEFDQVKASYKARETAAEAMIDKLSTDLMNGFEMRNKECVVVFRPRDRKKDFILKFVYDLGVRSDVALTEEMTQSDFQADLIMAESKFSNRAEIPLFPRVGNDYATLVVGKFNGLWFAALRTQIGGHKLEERLDSEQACAKKRFDIIKRTGDRFADWLVDRLGKDNAKGFKEPLEKAIAAEKEKVE